MTSISALQQVHIKGLFGNHKNKSEVDLLKISENKNLLIVQIVQYKNSSVLINEISIDNLKLKNEPVNVVSNKDTRVLWNGPNNWLLVSSKKKLLDDILKVFKDTDFAITDLSHSKAIIEMEGKNAKEVLKKGCPYNFNLLVKDNSINSTFNGMAFTVDIIDEGPLKIRLLSLRSFGESLYDTISDSSLEFGYKAI
jgi:sarcosine oxidase subunit gamma